MDKEESTNTEKPVGENKKVPFGKESQEVSDRRVSWWEEHQEDK